MPNLHRAISKYPLRDIEAIEIKYWDALLENAANSRDIELLKDIWRHIDKSTRNNTQLVLNYSTALLILDYADEAAKILQNALKIEWNEHLITAVGHIYRGNTKNILKIAQDFAQSHPDSDYAQLAVARILLRMEAYTDAFIYVEKAMHIRLTPDALSLFAEIKVLAGDEKAALSAYKKATQMLSQKAAPDPSGKNHLSVTLSPRSHDFLPIDHEATLEKNPENKHDESLVPQPDINSNELPNQPVTETVVIHSDSDQDVATKKD